MKTRLELAADLVRLARALTATPQTSANLIALLEGRVASLLDMRLGIRISGLLYPATYEDATGGLDVRDPTVQEARDSLGQLDREIGTTYQTLEKLVRKIKKHGK